MVKKLVTSIVLVWLALPLLVAQENQPRPSLEPGKSGPPAGARVTLAQQPLTQDEVQDLLKKNAKALDPVFKVVEERGVDFDLDPKIVQKLREAGADDDLVQAIWKAGPTSRNTKSATLTSSIGTPLHANVEEAMGYMTLEGELDPDRKMRMIEEFERRFPRSELMSSVYTQAAKTLEEKGDLNNAVVFGEKSLKLDPSNLFSLLIVALILPQPRMLQAAPQQAGQQLATAEAYATRALKLLDSVPAKPNETAEQLKGRRDALASDAHNALATVYMERNEPAKAIEEFKTAISLSPTPSPQAYFRLGEVYAHSGRNPEAIAAFTKASELGRGTVLQQYADQKIADLKK